MEEVFEALSDMYSIEVHAMPPVLAHCAISCCLELGGICSAAAARAFPRRRTIRSLMLRMSIPSAATLAPMSQDAVESSCLLDGPHWHLDALRRATQRTSSAAVSRATPAANIRADASGQRYSVGLTISRASDRRAPSNHWRRTRKHSLHRRRDGYGCMFELVTSRGGHARGLFLILRCGS